MASVTRYEKRRQEYEERKLIVELTVGNKWPRSSCEEIDISDLCYNWSHETQHHLNDGNTTVVIQAADNGRYDLEILQPDREPYVNRYIGRSNMLGWIEHFGFNWENAVLTKRTRRYCDFDKGWVIFDKPETQMEYLGRRQREQEAREKAEMDHKWRTYLAAKFGRCDENDENSIADIHTHASPEKHVYFICNPSTNRIKIGISVQPKARLRSLEMSSGEHLELLAVIDGGRDVERELHKRFAAIRGVGEWFDPHPDLLAYIDSLKESGAAS